MKAGAIAGIVIGIVLVIIAIIIVVVISIKKRRSSEILVPYSREDIDDKFSNPTIDNTTAIEGLYDNIGLEMSEIDGVLANKAPIKWIAAIKEYNQEIQKEEDYLKSLTKEELESINIPTLVVSGDKDIIPIEEAKYIANVIPNSKLIVLKGATHSNYMMKTDWEEELVKFIEEE